MRQRFYEAVEKIIQMKKSLHTKSKGRLDASSKAKNTADINLRMLYFKVLQKKLQLSWANDEFYTQWKWGKNFWISMSTS